jgi:K+-transporting ATPase ATPase A chain
MMLDEVVVGGLGSGLFGMLLFVIVAVFAAGLMIGRTPGASREEDRGGRGEDGDVGALVVPAFILGMAAVAAGRCGLLT